MGTVKTEGRFNRFRREWENDKVKTAGRGCILGGTVEEGRRRIRKGFEGDIRFKKCLEFSSDLYFHSEDSFSFYFVVGMRKGSITEDGKGEKNRKGMRSDLGE